MFRLSSDIWKGHKNWNYILNNVQTKWDMFFFNFGGLLRISQLDHKPTKKCPNPIPCFDFTLFEGEIDEKFNTMYCISCEYIVWFSIRIWVIARKNILLNLMQNSKLHLTWLISHIHCQDANTLASLRDFFPPFKYILVLFNFWQD